MTRDAPIGAGGLASDSLTEQALDSLVQELNAPNAGTNRIGPPMADAISGSMLFQMDQASQTLRGYGSLVPLHALLKSLQPVDGRKTILYFSEGLHAPDAVQPLFDAVMIGESANVPRCTGGRAGVTTCCPTQTSER